MSNQELLETFNPVGIECDNDETKQDNKRGVYGKYIISKVSGEPVDPEAQYFVLRLDTDDAAVEAARTYAVHSMAYGGNQYFGKALLEWIREIRREKKSYIKTKDS